ncbi:hypothetical protein K402DRAFT_459181 [Aulographum hederae CBS 113979]|uniref:Uncharacterized protein n=1 Tax=Aulographum hederae CBS 113979 TaxID=1176131 RepID=A0A6G1HG15_9PEZI|nr:hypothetical protein K402DRAFT_459181 [Aulographum hederae CBS 113979]
MKSTLFSLLLLASTATAKPFERRDEAPKAAAPAKPATIAELAPMMKPARAVEGKPEANASAAGHGHGGMVSGGILNPQTLLTGNMALAVAEFLSNPLDPEGLPVMHSVAEGICKNCSILAASFDAVFKNGTRADISTGVYLHHIIGLNLGKREMDEPIINQWLPFCSELGSMGSVYEQLLKVLNQLAGPADKGWDSSIFGFGAADKFTQYFTTSDGNFDSGFYFAPEDQLLLQAELVNYRAEYQEVYLQMDLEYVEGKAGKSATTSFSTVTPCNTLMFKGNGTAGTLISQDLEVQKDGTIVGARGHMHDGGTSMTVYLNDKIVCVSNATYGSGYQGSSSAAKWATIAKMSDCSDSIPVKKGDKIKVEAAYDEVAHPA